MTGDSKPGDDSSIRFRVTEREALKQTLEHFGINEGDLARRANVPSGALSEFKNGKRSVTTNTLDSILRHLSAEQYQYYLRVLVNSEGYLREVNPLLINVLDTPVEKSRAIYALVGSFVGFCSRDELLALLDAIYKASKRNRKFHGGGQSDDSEE